MGDEVELIGGREQRTIEVVEHDAGWAERFERERTRIGDALGAVARRIDHVGSTAVAGLAAKPIVDIDVSVEEPDDEGSYVPALEAAGYQLRVHEAGHRMLRTPELDVHVHVCSAGGAWGRRHLLFRDWLRTDAADRARYADAKRALARRDWPDMNSYADAKADVIRQITARAERWARATAWSVMAPAASRRDACSGSAWPQLTGPTEGRLVAVEPLAPEHEEGLFGAGRDRETWTCSSAFPNAGPAVAASVPARNVRGPGPQSLVRGPGPQSLRAPKGDRPWLPRRRLIG